MTALPSSWSLTARWIVPVDGPPLRDGVVTVQGERIVAVEPAGTRTPTTDLGHVVVLPGLVNAHTHLDLSGLRGRVPPGPDAPAWLGAVVAARRTNPTVTPEADVRAGLAEAVRTGTTLLADVSAGGASWPVLAAGPIRAVVFHELLGLSRERAGANWAAACSWLREHPAGANCKPALSPHAPYSVRGSLFRAAAARAESSGCPVTIHLAEWQTEAELLRRHEGPFVPFLKRLGVWQPDGLVSGWEALLALQGAAPLLLAHANYLSPDVPLPHHATVVYCPRTHAAFGHPPHPFREWLARGGRVALGTDSLASNPDLDLLAEARFLWRRHPEVRPDLVLRMATLAGAEALGEGDVAGSLTPGKSADLIVVPLPEAEVADPCRAVLEVEEPVRAVMSRGVWVGGAG